MKDLADAALNAARRGADKVTIEDFNTAIEKTLLGTERKLLLSPKDRERIAYHEARMAWEREWAAKQAGLTESSS